MASFLLDALRPIARPVNIAASSLPLRRWSLAGDGHALSIRFVPTERMALEAMRLDVLRCLPLLLPVLFYPFVGTFTDMMALGVVGLALFILHALPRLAGERTDVIIAAIASMAAGLFMATPAAGIIFLMIGVFVHGQRALPHFLGAARPVMRILAVVMTVDLGCIVLGIDRSIALLVMAGLFAAFSMLAIDASEQVLGAPEGETLKLLGGGALSCMTIASYLYLVSTDPALILRMGDVGLFTVPLVMLAVLRLFHLGFVSRSLDDNPLSALRDDYVLIGLGGWCLAMTMIEFAYPAF